MLYGEYEHNLDAKGRLIMPAKFREDLGVQFILTKGLDGCITGYPMSSWEIVEQKLAKLSESNRNARQYRRVVYAAATDVELDKQGRINLPKRLIEFAGIEKTCVIVGSSDRIEIWSDERWSEYQELAEENFEENAESLLDFDF